MATTFKASNSGMTVVWDVPSSRHRTQSDAAYTSVTSCATTASTYFSETSSTSLEEQRGGALRMTHTDEDVLHRHECQAGAASLVWHRVVVSLTRHWVIVEGSGMQWAAHYLDVTELSDSAVWGIYPGVQR